MATSNSVKNGLQLIVLENSWARIEMAPALGGKIVSVYNKLLKHEFLWTNTSLSLIAQSAGADYDSNFYGGIDELLPNDLPETIDGITYPDHGELWTTALEGGMDARGMWVKGHLPLSGLFYEKSLRLDPEASLIFFDYHLRNDSSETRHFLWKLHAPLKIQPGDRLLTSAQNGQVVDPAYSRFTDTQPFAWPVIENTDAAVVPEKNGTVDFFYLYDVSKPEMHLSLKNGVCLFGYRYDPAVFPFQWYFASYGGFLNHYTVILEPCSNMPMSVNEAMKKDQCVTLEPGASLRTTVEVFAGLHENYKPGHA